MHDLSHIHNEKTHIANLVKSERPTLRTLQVMEEYSL